MVGLGLRARLETRECSQHPRRGSKVCGDISLLSSETGVGKFVQHLSLFFPVDEVVVVLHRDEFVPGHLSATLIL